MYSWLIACEFENGAIGNLDLTIAIRADCMRVFIYMEQMEQFSQKHLIHGF